MISIKFCTVVSHSLSCIFSHFGGDTPWPANARCKKGRGLEVWLLGNIFDYLQNGKSSRVMSIRI